MLVLYIIARLCRPGADHVAQSRHWLSLLNEVAVSHLARTVVADAVAQMVGYYSLDKTSWSTLKCPSEKCCGRIHPVQPGRMAVGRNRAHFQLVLTCRDMLDLLVQYWPSPFWPSSTYTDKKGQPLRQE
jgi:hypothetical protein